MTHKPSTNTNVLEGMQCPKCGYDEVLKIQSTACVRYTDEGSDDIGDLEWDEDSYCECCECAHYGTVAEFKGEKPKPKEPTAQDELVAALDEIEGWLVCAAISSPQDMAQSFPKMLDLVQSALKKAKG